MSKHIEKCDLCDKPTGRCGEDPGKEPRVGVWLCPGCGCGIASGEKCPECIAKQPDYEQALAEQDARIAQKTAYLLIKDESIAKLKKQVAALRDSVYKKDCLLHQRKQQIQFLQPYCCAIRDRHNDYDPSVRAEFGTHEPESPKKALDELIEEATNLGRYEAEVLARQHFAKKDARIAQLEAWSEWARAFIRESHCDTCDGPPCPICAKLAKLGMLLMGVQAERDRPAEPLPGFQDIIGLLRDETGEDAGVVPEAADCVHDPETLVGGLIRCRLCHAVQAFPGMKWTNAKCEPAGDQEVPQ